MVSLVVDPVVGTHDAFVADDIVRSPHAAPLVKSRKAFAVSVERLQQGGIRTVPEGDGHVSLIMAVVAEAPQKQVASPHVTEAERLADVVEVRPVGDSTTIEETVAAGRHPLAYPAQHQIRYAGAEHLVAGQQTSGGGSAVDRPRWRAARHLTILKKPVRHLAHEGVDPIQGVI